MFPRRYLRIEWISYLTSSSEEWRLLNAEGREIASGNGEDCGQAAVAQSRLLCVDPGVYQLQQRVINRHTNVNGGTVNVQLSTPLWYRKEEKPYFVTVMSQSFARCSSTWSGPATSQLSACAARFFSSGLIIDTEMTWSMTREKYMEPSWTHVNYHEDSRWYNTTLRDISYTEFYRLRGKFEVADPSALEAVDLILVSLLHYTVYLNGKLLGEVDNDYSDYVHSMRIASDCLLNGTNVLAIRVVRQLRDRVYYAPIITLQPVFEATTYWDDRAVYLSASNTRPGYSVSSLVDGNWKTNWVGEMKSGQVSVRVEFSALSSQMIRGYCLTSSTTTVLFSPVQWQVRIRSMDRRWYDVASVTRTHFHLPGERRCFPLQLDNYVFVMSGMEIVFSSEGTQTMVELAELELITFSLLRFPLPAFSYGVRSVDVVANVEFPEIPLPSFLYSNYISTMPLPPGLILDNADGHFWGMSPEPFETVTVEILAQGPKGRVSTKLTLSSKTCASPFSLVKLQLANIEDLSFFLSFTITDGKQNVVASSFVLPSMAPTPTVFTYCVETGDYVLSFTDKSNAGFTRASFSLFSDDILLQSGLFNAGFSNQRIPFFAGSILPGDSTLWYYSLDDEEPPDRWYTAIDPVHEVWEVAKPHTFPPPQGRAQYFKTVMDVSSIRPSQQLYSAFVLDLDVCGGAVVYVNGVEVLRHQLPLGVLTKDTVPLESFPRTERVSAALSMQFNVWEKDVVVVAVEIHDASLQPRSEFRLGVRLLPDGSQRHIGGSLSVNKPKGMVEDLNHLTDGLYYNKMVVHGSCDDIQVTIDSHQHAYEYVTEICLYAGNSAGEYPHTLVLDGGTRGTNVTWTTLYSTDVFFRRVAYGQYACYHLFNDHSFSLFRLHFDDCEHKPELEVAEVEFFADRLDGYCEDLEGKQRRRTPSGEWRDFGCSELYIGRYLEYCNNGTWSEVMNLCRPKAPIAFKYKSAVFYVTRRDVVELRPTVVGAELLFETSMVPQGFVFDNATGVFMGVYYGEERTVNVTVTVRNAGGKQSTSFTLIVINNNEELIVIIAFIAVACLVGAIVYISVLLNTSNSDSIQLEAEMSHLHTNEVPKKMLPLLV